MLSNFGQWACVRAGIAFVIQVALREESKADARELNVNYFRKVEED